MHVYVEKWESKFYPDECYKGKINKKLSFMLEVVD